MLSRVSPNPCVTVEDLMVPAQKFRKLHSSRDFNAFFQDYKIEWKQSSFDPILLTAVAPLFVEYAKKYQAMDACPCRNTSRH